MKIIDVKLDTVCGYTSTLPVFDEPEIAFAGKSNVGKSSLINVLMKRKRLARVGETPGKTRTINFYKILAEVPDEEKIKEEKAAGEAEEAGRGAETAGNAEAERAIGRAKISEAAGDVAAVSTEVIPRKKLRWKNDPTKKKGAAKLSTGKQGNAKQIPVNSEPIIPVIRKSFFLVDLPGYGYANVSEDEKARWGQMIEKYLNTSQRLHRVFLLVDIRHEPNANDIQMYRWVIHSGFTPVIIATKADKLSKNAVLRQTEVVRRGLGAPEDTVVIPFSALTGQGASEIYRVIGESL